MWQLRSFNKRVFGADHTLDSVLGTGWASGGQVDRGPHLLGARTGERDAGPQRLPGSNRFLQVRALVFLLSGPPAWAERRQSGGENGGSRGVA